MKENEIEAYLTAQVRKRGGLAVKHVSPGRAGDPDRLVKLPGRPMAFIELKAPGHEPRPEQYERLNEWSLLGVVASWACSKHQVDEFLKEVERQ